MQAGELELKARRKKQKLEDREKARALSDMHARLTAGNMVHHNVYHIGKETMEYVKQQQAKKVRKESEIASKKYRANMKVYQDGINLQKEESKWNGDDYMTMIKFKQLFKENMPALPKTLPTKKERWETVKYFPDPLISEQPEDYIPEAAPVVLTTNHRGESDDKQSEASVAMFQV